MSKRPPKGLRYLNLGPWPVFVGFTTNEKAFHKEMKRIGVDEQNFLGHVNANATTHFFTNNGSLLCIIAIQPFKAVKRSKEAYAALVAHEAMHVIQEMQRELARGKTLGEEAEAYLIQQIVQECLQDAWASKWTRRTKPA